MSKTGGCWIIFQYNMASLPPVFLDHKDFTAGKTSSLKLWFFNSKLIVCNHMNLKGYVT